MEKKSIEKRLSETLKKETKKFDKKESKIELSLEEFEKMGIEIKTTYSLPLKDTIGRELKEPFQSPSRKDLHLR